MIKKKEIARMWCIILIKTIFSNTIIAVPPRFLSCTANDRWTIWFLLFALFTYICTVQYCLLWTCSIVIENRRKCAQIIFTLWKVVTILRLKKKIQLNMVFFILRQRSGKKRNGAISNIVEFARCFQRIYHSHRFPSLAIIEKEFPLYFKCVSRGFFSIFSSIKTIKSKTFYAFRYVLLQPFVL